RHGIFFLQEPSNGATGPRTGRRMMSFGLPLSAFGVVAMIRCLVCLSAVLFLPNLCGAAEPEITIQKDIVYNKTGDTELKLDLAMPPEGKGPYPLVLCIHGGAWHIGSRAAHHPTIRRLAENGYVAATVQYRFAPKTQFPGQIEDVKAAVRYLR